MASHFAKFSPSQHAILPSTLSVPRSYVVCFLCSLFPFCSGPNEVTTITFTIENISTKGASLHLMLRA